MATKKRKKRKRYHTGTHRSPKCKMPIEYRSGWELTVCHYLDNDPAVVEYGYECVVIPYLSNQRTGKIRSYFPDFLVTYKDGTRKLIEVKRKDKLNDPKVMKKAKAAEAWCAKQGIRYEMWTNVMIEAFRKLNEAAGITPTTKSRVPSVKRRSVTKAASTKKIVIPRRRKSSK